MAIKTLKPLDFGKGKLVPPEEALRQLEKYQPSRPEPDEEIVPPAEPDTPPDSGPISEPSAERISGKYILMPETTTYALGVEALREACKNDPSSPHFQFTRDNGSKIYRPLTFRENLRARVEDFNTAHDQQGSERSIDDRLRLFGHWIDSCTSASYKAKSKKFKLTAESPYLIEIAKDFNDEFIAVTYKKIQGVELNSGKRRVKYNELLTENEVNDHEGWRNTVGDDTEGRDLLKEYSHIVFAQLERKYKRKKGMRFWVRQDTEDDELRALFVYDLNVDSNACGSSLLNVNGSFLRVAHPQAPQGTH